MITAVLFLTLAGTSSPITVPAARTAEPPVIDGILGAEWDAASVIDTVMTQYGPVRGEPMSDPTRILFMYDDDFLYVGFRLYDSSPGGMNDALCPRDDYNPGEWIALLLDTWGDGRQAFSFEVNLANSRMDSRINTQGGWDYSWDAVWSSATSADDSGWVCEMSIPMSQLRFPTVESQDWTFNIQRIITRGTQNGWLVLSETTDQMDVDNFASLTGLEGLHASVGVEARPYVAGRAVRRSDLDGSWEDDYDAGADLKIGITSNIVADLTVNPDFGQVEADEDQMNLSHFELFLAEKRPFFLEAGDVFDMPFNLFYSRRVGAVTPYGSVIPILGGAKVSGILAQGLSFGFLDALTDQVTEEGMITSPMTNYSVLRVKQGFGPLSFLGFSATSVDVPSQDGLESSQARSGAVDGWLRVGDNAVLTGAVARTWNPEDVSGSAYSAGAAVQGEETFWELGAEYIEDDFDANAAGFTTSTGIWDAYSHLMRSIDFGGPFLSGAAGIFANYSADLDGTVNGRGVNGWVEMPFRDGGSITPGISWSGSSFDRWEGPGGTWYPQSWSGSLRAGTSWYAPVRIGAEVEGGEHFQEGTFESYEVDLTLRPGTSASIDLEAGVFRTFNSRCFNWEAEAWDSRNTEWRDLVARVNWMYGPDASMRVFSQYSRFETDFDITGPQPGEEVTFNTLYSLEYRPGSMLYLLGELLTERGGTAAWSKVLPGFFLKMTWFEAF